MSGKDPDEPRKTVGTVFLNFDDSRTILRWGLAGAVTIGLHLVLALLSSRFTYGSDILSRPIPLFVGIIIPAGVVYLVVSRGFLPADHAKGLVVWAVAVGLIIRLCAMASTPVLEDDYYRYLWDGGVLANGYNPYAYSPDEVLLQKNGARQVPSSLHRLAVESGPIVQRVNHPRLRTIYPPVAQAFFALSYLIRPWSLLAWRFVLLGVDLLVLLLMIKLLRRSGLPILYSVIYWWNPLLVKEVFNSGHMDILAFPFVLGALWMASREYRCRSAALLALAGGVKIWPVALLPLVLHPISRNPRRLLPALATFIFLLGMIFLPVLRAGLDPGSGFTAYGERWEINDAFFMAVSWGTDIVTGAICLPADYQRMVPRILVFILFLAWTFKITRREGGRDFYDLSTRSLWIIAGLFMLSPTQFPWYSLWMLPFLTICPRTSLLLLTVLLPLYYLRFYLRARGDVDLFDNVIVWIEYAPVWIMLLREWIRTRNGTENPVRERTARHAAGS